MILSSPTTGLLGPSLAALLRSMESSEDGKSGREWAQESGVSTAQTNQLLRRLVSLGLVNVSHRPPAKLYALNFQHALVPSLLRLLTVSAELEDEILEALDSLTPPPDLVAIFGSYARGEDSEESDLDLLAVWSQEEDFGLGALMLETAEFCMNFKRRTGNDLNISFLKMSDLRASFQDKTRFAKNLVSDGRALKGGVILQTMKEKHQWNQLQDAV